MEQNTRRGFLKSLGFLGALASGAATAKVIDQKNDIQKENIDHLAPLGTTTFMLNADNREEKLNTHGQYTFTNINPVYTNTVKMSVGKDNRLWLEVDGKWHRVALES